MEYNVLEKKQELLRNEWKNYIHSHHTSEETRKIIMESWERCRNYGIPDTNNYPLHVLSEQELKEKKETHRELLEISAPIRSQLEGFIRESQFVIAVTDSEGIILDITGNEHMKQSIIGGGFIEGADWGEKSVGTNAIGTALALDQPVQFAGYEHFCTFTQKTACAAAPVHDPEGNLIGSIDLTGRLRDVNHHTLGIAVAMASDIENCLRISRTQKKLHLENAFKSIMLESMTQGVIALDDRNLITHMNQSAKNILRVTDDYIGEDVKPILALRNQPLLKLILENKEITDKEITINKTAKQTIRLIGTSRNIKNAEQGQKLGIIFIFDEIRRTQRIAARYVGATASLTFDNIIGKNSTFQKTLTLAKYAAHSDASVLLLGESGVGKDIMAQAIHNASNRRNAPYVAINCGAIPRELIASELFGYVEGAFTGARKGGNPGKFEMADGGTVFLDEIGEMPLDLQVHLLRVLENRTISRIGSSESIPIDIRIIAATNTNLFQLVQDKLFRSDLYYRLNVISLHLPPLRERQDDIPLLIQHFYKQFYDGPINIPNDFESVLRQYSWPGNIRELRNVIERTVILSPDKLLRTEYLPQDILTPFRQNPVASFTDYSITRGTAADIEKEILIDYLHKTDGNISQTAKALGVARTTIYRKVRLYGINLNDL